MDATEMVVTPGRERRRSLAGGRGDIIETTRGKRAAALVGEERILVLLA